MKLDLHTLCQEHKIDLYGIIQVGSSQGRELNRYPVSDNVRVLLIEANPNTAQLLRTQFEEQANIQVIQCAVTDQNDTATLHIPAIESNSSILPFTGYREIYPNLQDVQTISVESRTLDTLLVEHQLKPEDFNLLSLNIHGAELLALQGATELLLHLPAIYTTVNHQNLFEGGALLKDVDQFLEQYGLHRVAQANPYHPAWGEAFYVRRVGETLQPYLSVASKNYRTNCKRFSLSFSSPKPNKKNLKLRHNRQKRKRNNLKPSFINLKLRQLN